MKKLPIYLIIYLIILIISSCSDSDDFDNSKAIKTSLEYSDVYTTDRAKIEFNIISGGGNYQVQSSDETVAEVAVTGNIVNVEFYKYAEVDITITDGKMQSLIIRMKSTSEDIIALTTYYSMRIGKTVTESIRGSGEHYLLKVDNEYIKASIDKNNIVLTGIKEGETEVRYMDSKGNPYAFNIRIGDPNPAKVSSTVDHDWVKGDLNYEININQLTRIHLLWANDDLEDFSWDESHNYGRIINSTSPDGYPILEIVTSSYSWGGPWVKHLYFTDDQGKRHNLRLSLK